MVKISNRRKRRNEYLLDVKVHTEGRVRQRAKWLVVVTAFITVTFFTGYGLYRLGQYVTAKMFFENPRFAITRVVVQDDGQLTPQQVMEFAGVAVGQNILAFDLGQAQRNLEALPVIRRVEVRRVMPAKIVIHVDERIAVAQIRLAGANTTDTRLFIDRSGMIMTPVRMRDGSMIQPQAAGQLPVLTGVAPADARVGKQAQSEQIYRGLELLDKLQQAAAGSMLEIAAVDLSKPRHLTLTTRQNTVVKFDVADFTQQLRRLSAIMTWAAQRQRVVQAVDLTVARGVPVTFIN